MSSGSPLEHLVIGDHCCNQIAQFNQLQIKDFYSLRTIHIGNFSFINCREFILKDLHLLTTCIIKSYSFTNHVFSTIQFNPLKKKYFEEANAQPNHSSTMMAIEEEEENDNNDNNDNEDMIYNLEDEDMIYNSEDEDMENSYSVTEILRKLAYGEIGFSEHDDYESDEDVYDDSPFVNWKDETYNFYSDDTDDPYCQEQDGFVNLCDDNDNDNEDDCIQDTSLLDLVEKSKTKADPNYDYSTDCESRFSFCYAHNPHRSLNNTKEDGYALAYPNFNPDEAFWTCLDGKFVIENCAQLEVISLGAFSFARYRDLSITCRFYCLFLHTHFHFHFHLLTLMILQMTFIS